MLTIGLSVSSCIKQLEKSLIVPVKSFSKAVHELVYDMTPAAEASSISLTVPDGSGVLRIAKTTMPDKRLDFNDTFQHIRSELDAIYKERNPIFDNTAVPELWVSKSVAGAGLEQREKSPLSIDGTLAEPADKICTVYESAKTPALWISKTVQPEERPDFNETFRNVRSGLDGFYKARNPIFNNTIEPLASLNEHAAEAADPAPGDAEMPLSHSAAQVASDRTAVRRDAMLSECWVSIPAVADL